MKPDPSQHCRLGAGLPDLDVERKCRMADVMTFVRKIIRRCRVRIWYLALLATVESAPALAAPFAYVPNGPSCMVSVVDTADDSVVASVTETHLCGASGVAVSPDGTRAYVTRHALALDGVTVIDTATETVITEVFTGPGSGPAGLAVTPDGAFVYVALAGYRGLRLLQIRLPCTLPAAPQSP